MAGGRPRIEIDQQDFESLLAIQCTLEEVTAFFEHKLGKCSQDTIERWCKRTYKENFAEVSAKKRNIGKISLRRSGWQLAQKNPAVHIFYCKNYLGMTDKIETDNSEEIMKKLDDVLSQIGEEEPESEGE
ncbi:hypothetical protein [Ruminococcus sp.]|uniref:hypothetical protein n=1 Tax=Ruminococcus sp. TaxID=41978 RepID=UPI001B42FC7E|nr:hypothetical protein [Ruminococcus sp.]MBP5432223.1 hypothetical protein [Ruminococcus sp.]